MLWEYLWAWSSITKWLYHLNWDAIDRSWNLFNWTPTNVTWAGWRLWSWSASLNWSSSKIVMWNVNDITWLTPLTIWFFIKYTQWSSYGFIISKIWDTNYTWYTIFHDQVTQKISFSLAKNPEWQYCAVVLPNTINDWNRHNVFFTYNWDKNANNMKWYVDWISKTLSIDTNTLTLDINNTNNFSIWSRNWNDFFFNWQIDEVIIENRVWTAEEIRKYYTYSQWKFIL